MDDMCWTEPTGDPYGDLPVVSWLHLTHNAIYYRRFENFASPGIDGDTRCVSGWEAIQGAKVEEGDIITDELGEKTITAKWRVCL